MGLVVIPIALALFFIAILDEGLPLQAPVGIVDLDHTPMSRRLTRNLGASELLQISDKQYNSYNEALDGVKRGEIMGFFVIPEHFERDAEAQTGTNLAFYCNLTYYVPGSLVYKAFKTMAVTSAGEVVTTSLVGKGLSPELSRVALMPLVLDIRPVGNPWISYAYYLGPSFIIGSVGLMALLMSVFVFMSEIKEGTSRSWLDAAGNHIATAIFGKLIPLTLVLTVVAVFVHSLIFHYCGYPMNGNEWNMLLGLLLFIIACESLGVVLASIIPSPRFALSLASLIGILTFSIAAFSFPVEAMYGSIGIFSYILPVRYYFLIYIDQALNGIDLYFSRWWYVGLLCFPIAATLVAPLMRRWSRHPVYVP